MKSQIGVHLTLSSDPGGKNHFCFFKKYFYREVKYDCIHERQFVVWRLDVVPNRQLAPSVVVGGRVFLSGNRPCVVELRGWQGGKKSRREEDVMIKNILLAALSGVLVASNNGYVWGVWTAVGVLGALTLLDAFRSHLRRKGRR